MRGQDLIKPRHLERAALVYVRQSTPGQVLSNRESTRLQYGLREQAVELGWAKERVETIDDDLGVSASGEQERAGFARMSLAVARGRAGAVFGLDATRLSRNTAEWFELLRWLELTDTLLVEDGQVYDLASGDDSFLLGIKGSLSARERYMLARRMDAGKRSKAERGELYASLPAGYVLAGGRLAKDPDEQVRHAVGQVFEKFREAGSARQAALALRQAGTRLPSRPGGREGAVRWSEASYERVYALLTNPAMGGAYAWGRQRTELRLAAGGQRRKRIRKLPRERWRVLLEGHHEGYVSWAEWLQVQDRLRKNAVPWGKGAPREGRALLQGLARCGVCGRRMQVRYGNAVQYCCRPGVEAGGVPSCQTVGAARVDPLVAEALLEAVRPAGVEAALEAERLAGERESSRLRSYRLEVERREYDCRRAEREYRNVEPEYRLVKRTLAQDWERAQAELQRAQAELERVAERAAPPAPDPERLAGLAERVRRLWEHPALEMRDRKRLLATLLEEAVLRVDREAGAVRMLLHWNGGWIDEVEAPWAYRKVEGIRYDGDTIELVRQLARRLDDVQIARTLNRQGRRTARGLEFTARRVQYVRKRYGVPAYELGREEQATLLSVPEAARELGVSPSSVYRWLQAGFAAGEQAAPGAPQRVRVDEELRSRVCGNVPEGFVPHREALQRAGVSRETLRRRIRAGELEARWINRGPRKGLYVRVEPPRWPLLEGLEEDGNA